MGILVRLLLTAFAVWVAVQVVGGLEYSGGWLGLLGIAFILAIVNGLARPLVTLLSLPLVILTLGLFLLVINALMFNFTIWISGELALGLTSTGFNATFVGAVIITAVSWVGELVLGTD